MASEKPLAGRTEAGGRTLPGETQGELTLTPTPQRGPGYLPLGVE